jgi:hypothetical protein
MGRGFFGGEGFIMQKIEGDGLAFVHSGGTLAKKELRAGEVLKVDTGCIVDLLKMSITILNSLEESRTPFSVEKVLRHPSRPWNRLHTILPFSRLVTELLLQHLKQEEIAAVKEAYYGLGNLLDGDNRIKFYYPAIL